MDPTTAHHPLYEIVILLVIVIIEKLFICLVTFFLFLETW